jgi:microcystin degradation protein MlrC
MHRARRAVGHQSPMTLPPEAAHRAGAGRVVDLGNGREDGRAPRAAAACTRLPVVGLHDGRFTGVPASPRGENGIRHGSDAIVRTASGVTIQLTSQRTPPFSLNQLLSCGIEAGEVSVLVAKGVNAPIAAYQPRLPAHPSASTRRRDDRGHDTTPHPPSPPTDVPVRRDLIRGRRGFIS